MFFEGTLRLENMIFLRTSAPSSEYCFLFFRSSTVDGKEVLSAKLFIKMKSDESGNLNPLRKEICRGKLGKFKVVAYPDNFDGEPYM